MMEDGYWYCLCLGVCCFHVVLRRQRKDTVVCFVVLHGEVLIACHHILAAALIWKEQSRPRGR